MRLRTNEPCPIYSSLSCCGRELLPKPKLARLGVQRIEDPHRNCDHRPRCASCSTARSANKLVYAQSATKSFAIITTSSPTIGIRKEWAEGGGTIIRTTSKPHIGGVTKIVAEHGHELRNRPRSLGQWPRAFSKIFSIGSESTSPDWL